MIALWCEPFPVNIKPTSEWSHSREAMGMPHKLRSIHVYSLYNEDEGLSNIHDRGRSPRTCIFDDPESELYNRLVPECGGVSASYWFIRSCPMKLIRQNGGHEKRRRTVCRFADMYQLYN